MFPVWYEALEDKTLSVNIPLQIVTEDPRGAKDQGLNLLSFNLQLRNYFW